MTDICGDKCMGYDDNHGGCCTLYDRDFIIGPHIDPLNFLSRLENKFGRKIKYSEVFIDYEEGKNLFPHLSYWQRKQSYPALRVNTQLNSKPCIFYNETVRRCSVYEIRPAICSNFQCEYLKKHSGKTCQDQKN